MSSDRSIHRNTEEENGKYESKTSTKSLTREQSQGTAGNFFMYTFKHMAAKSVQ